MLRKRVTAILYGCDRRLWGGGALGLRVTDLFASGGPRALFEADVDGPTVELDLKLPFDAGQVYAIAFSVPGHRPAWRFVRHADFLRASDQIEQDDLILRLMLVPDAPGTTDLANGFDRLQHLSSPFTASTGIDAAAFEALNVAAKMALLNIEAKLRETVIDGAPLLSYVRGISRVAVDRLFVLFDTGLKARIPRWREFASAPGHAAPKGTGLPAHPDSWKHTLYAEGNVQLSFSGDAVSFPDGAATLVHSADVDIDLGRGLAHAREWLENNVFRPGHKTNQALVYAQLYAQGILPQYVLDPAPATTREAPRLRSIRRPDTGPRAQRTVSRSKAPVRATARGRRTTAGAPKRRTTRKKGS